MARWMTIAVTFIAFTFLGSHSEGGESTRNIRWSEDIDYLVDRLEITHPNLYANISAEEFQISVEQLKQRIATASDVEIVFSIQELVARIRNAHTLCYSPLFMEDNDALKRQFQFYPVLYYPFSDGLYTTAVAARYEPILGKRVIQMGGMTSAEVMSNLARFIGADNENTPLSNLPRFYLSDGQLLRYIGAANSPDSMTLTLEDGNGSVFDYTICTDSTFGTGGVSWITMVTASDNPPPLYRKHESENYWFDYLSEQQAIYLQINLMYNIDSDPFEAFCQRLFDTLDANRAERLIVDVRGCPGGDHIELPLLKGILARPQIDQPDRLFLIIGRRTGSASQHLTSEFEHYTNATLFGEPTASKPNQYGAMQQLTLPHSKLQIVCATKYFQDTEPADYSMASTPDIYVSVSSDDFRANRDPVLERVFSYDSYKQLGPAFRELMSNAYLDGGIDGFKRTYDSVKATYSEYGFNMEKLLFKDLDAWMGENRRSDDDYVEYLRFVYHELPNSIPVCYDLGWWMNERGDKEDARKLWEKCLALNPEHHHARRRLGLMKLEEAPN
ncbi:MAG: hypothetical protein JSV52_04505 [Candidatus Zixiibacteriota bacterium]|nr:MAG: hypothetical protein JSV52_04505 [candidate division Zixibacteria bacterium]